MIAVFEYAKGVNRAKSCQIVPNDVRIFSPGIAALNLIQAPDTGIKKGLIFKLF
jgi:hypothetical protein